MAPIAEYRGGTSLARSTGMATHTTFHCELPVFYATSEGQTARIAEHVAAVLCEHGLSSRAIDIASAEGTIDWSAVRGAVVGASIHLGRHQREAEEFVERFAMELNRIPSAFFSVSLSAASRNLHEVEAAQALADTFPKAYGWRPAVVAVIAGRLAYTQYGFLKRLLMRQIARKEGGPTDTSRDYELTDWERVDTFARGVAGLVGERTARKQLTAA